MTVTEIAFRAKVTEGTVRGLDGGSTASVRFETGVLFAEAFAPLPRLRRWCLDGADVMSESFDERLRRLREARGMPKDGPHATGR